MNAFENMKKSVLVSQRGVYIGGVVRGELGQPELKFKIYETKAVAGDIRD